MAGLGDVFGRGSIGEQLFVWGVLSDILHSLTDPASSELLQLMRSEFPVEPLSPSAAADLVARGHEDQSAGEGEAAKSGTDSDRFRKLVQLAYSRPPAEVLLELLRRGVIPADGSPDGAASVVGALRASGMHPDYADLYLKLAVQNPSWNDAMDALLEGQLDEATAKHWYTLAGGNPDAFQWLFDTRGTSPTPDMLGTMANRGIIEWDGTGPDAVTFAQGFLEGPWRNKWEKAMRQLMAYHPPPRTVTALLRSGAITEAEALTLFKQQGLSPELAAAYVKDASHHATTSVKELTKAEIEQLYQLHVLTKEQAQKMLHDLGYSDTSAGVLLQGVDLRRTISTTNSAINRIRTLYVGHKIDKQTAQASLHSLGIAETQATQLLGTWDVEESANLKLLTPSQVGDAFKLEIITQAEAISELVAYGYTPWDAWVVLSVHMKTKLPGEPTRGPAPIGGL